MLLDLEVCPTVMAARSCAALRLQTGRPGVPPTADPGHAGVVLGTRSGAGRVAGAPILKGADDYLVKPFDMDELEARLRHVMRRAAGQASPVIRHVRIWRSGPGCPHHPAEGGAKVEVRRAILPCSGPCCWRAGSAVAPANREHLYSWGRYGGNNAVVVYVPSSQKAGPEGSL